MNLINFEKLPQKIQQQLENIVLGDPYNLAPNTLYRNIAHSLKSVPPDVLSEIMEVPISLINSIKNINKNFYL